MRRMTLIGVAALLALPGAVAAEPADPYSPPPPAGSVARLDRDAMFGEPGSTAAIARWLASHPQAPVADRILLYHRLCNIYGARAWHALRLPACSEEHRLNRNAAGDDDDVAMSRALRDTAPIRVSGSAAIPLIENALGSKSGAVTVNGITLDWFIDTGAQISVLPQSNADRLGVHYVGDSVRVGTSTTPIVGRVGVIDLMRIGQAEVENVPVLVLPDAQLTVADRPTIPGILSLQVFAAFRRMAWLDGETRLVLGDEAPRPNREAVRIFWHDKGLGIPIRTPRGIRAAHFDSGADDTYLFGPGRVLLTPAELAAATPHTFGVGGAGGVAHREGLRIATLTLSISGLDATLRDVTLLTSPDDRAARIGNDVIRQSQRLILDFETMTMSAEGRPSG